MSNKLRILCLLLALCLLPLVGQAEDQSSTGGLFGALLLEEDSSLRSSVVVDDTAYMLTNDTLYSYRQGDEQPKALMSYRNIYDPEDSTALRPFALYADGKQLMGIDFVHHMCFPILMEEGKVSHGEGVAIDWRIFGEGEAMDPPSFVTCFEGKLYFKQGNFASELEADLHSIDMRTGDTTTYKPLYLNGLVPYKDGKLLGIYFDQNKGEIVDNRYEQMTPEIHVFDPQQNSSEKLDLQLLDVPSHENSRLNLYYDQTEDHVYVANTSGLYRLSPDAAPVMTGRLPSAGTWNNPPTTPVVHPWPDGQLLLAYNYNAYLCGKDEGLLPDVVTLRITGHWLDSTPLIYTMMELPQLAIQTSFEDLNPRTVSAQFLSREMKQDLLQMYTGSYDLQRMMQKGYLLDLTDDPALSAIGQDSFEALRPAMYHHDRLYLLPVNINSQSAEANLVNLKTVGREIPTTVQELLDLVKWWAEEGHIQHEGYQLFEYGGIKEALRFFINSVYVDSLLAQDKPLQYDMAVFGHFMQQLDAMDTRDIEPDPDDEEMGNGSGNGYGNYGKPLMSLYAGYHPRERFPDEEMQPMPISIDKNTPPYRRADLSVLGIPATTQHPEEAKLFLATYLSKLRDRNKAILSRSFKGPVLNPRYEEMLESNKRFLAMQERNLEKAEGAEKHEAEELVKQQREFLANFEQTGKYVMSEKTIAEHKDFMRLLYVTDSLSMVLNDALNDKDGNHLLHMYGQGAISLEQFIQQANDKIRLMTLEQQ